MNNLGIGGLRFAGGDAVLLEDFLDGGEVGGLFFPFEVDAAKHRAAICKFCGGKFIYFL